LLKMSLPHRAAMPGPGRVFATSLPGHTVQIVNRYEFYMSLTGKAWPVPTIHYPVMPDQEWFSVNALFDTLCQRNTVTGEDCVGMFSRAFN